MNITGINQSDICLGFSCPEISVSTAVYVLLYVSAAAVVLLTVCGNLLIIISVCHFKQLHTPTNMLILSLAVSDFLVGVLLMPTALIWIIESCWIFNIIYCIFFILASFSLTTTSIFIVALIAVDRYFALSNPFLYTKAVSVNKNCAVVVFLCILFLCCHIALQYFNGYYIVTNIVMCPGYCFSHLDEGWFLFDLLVKFAFPLAVIITLYGRVFVIARKHATAIRDFNIQRRTKNNTDSMRSERKAAKVLGILVSIFVACLLPYYIYTILGIIIQIEIGLFLRILLLLYLNSTINPVIYALFYPWFRKCVKLILTLRIFNRDSSLMNIL
ncbi:trace amine-associated receptor 13c-like [Hoplias malabaricus]|uniref:trace amine-associated receptor 13c-like n=1 Tax=Hoplias malabaricus TaxID=27720 RepID=UPI0034619700